MYTRDFRKGLDARHLEKGEEQYELYYSRIARRNLCQYDYRAEDGELFSTVQLCLEKCREKREEWRGRQKEREINRERREEEKE